MVHVYAEPGDYPANVRSTLAITGDPNPVTAAASVLPAVQYDRPDGVDVAELALLAAQPQHLPRLAVDRDGVVHAGLLHLVHEAADTFDERFAVTPITLEVLNWYTDTLCDRFAYGPAGRYAMTAVIDKHRMRRRYKAGPEHAALVEFLRGGIDAGDYSIASYSTVTAHMERLEVTVAEVCLAVAAFDTLLDTPPPPRPRLRHTDDHAPRT